jgi:hypothetical protein
MKKQYPPSASRTGIETTPAKIDHAGHKPVASLNLHEPRYSLRIAAISHHIILDSSSFTNRFDAVESGLCNVSNATYDQRMAKRHNPIMTKTNSIASMLQYILGLPSRVIQTLQ